MATASPRVISRCSRHADRLQSVRILYTLLAYIACPLVSVVLLLRGLSDRSYWQRFPERFGYGEPPLPGGIWIHAVSVGEVQAAAPLVAVLRERYPAVSVLVTTFTPTGAARARTLFREQASVRYIPFDLPGSVRRFLRRAQPRIAVIFETEIWPNLYHECARQRVPLVLASARISSRSVGRYLRFGSLFRAALSRGTVIAAQGERDAERFRALGTDPERTHVTGNIKFDFSVPHDIGERAAALSAMYAQGRPVWVAGSTHTGEDEQVLEAHRIARGSQPRALLVLAPRHPTRFNEVADRLERAGVRFVRRSLRAGSGVGAAIANAEVLLLDSLGELLDFYAAADVAFVGGSLVPIGGHNLLEPAALGLPVLTGPYNSNSEEVARLLLERGAAEIVHDGSELGARVAVLLSNSAERARIGERGKACVAANRGALSNLLGLVEPLLRGQGA
jgi:3-deoxy-D-manno-octulosonic-acid transferase